MLAFLSLDRKAGKMSFKTDKQTLDDLAILGNSRVQSVYSIFNRSQTRGGAGLLEEMFRYPLSDAEAINRRSGIIRYYRDMKLQFPFRASIFDAIEFYLSNTDRRTQLQVQDNTLERKFKNLVGSDTEYTQIHNGITGCIELLNTLGNFLQASEQTEKRDAAVDALLGECRELLSLEKWSFYREESDKKKLPYVKAVAYDKVFRFEERDRLLKILQRVYLLDVYMSVAAVSRDRGFVFGEALPAEANVLELDGIYHPFLKNPVGNTLCVDESGNVVFLTGANMAGKSTFMKAFGITLYLAHVGFPLPAERVRFSVRSGMFTTINLPDNLNMGYSHFYAEVLRVKKVAQQVRQTPHLVIIFDELFRGTNVKDAHEATVAVVNAFAGIRDCTFVISTHIIEAGDDLKRLRDNIRYVYLPTRLDGNRPVYTYKLEEGITSDRHGMMIVNNERIIEIIKGGVQS